MRSKQRLISDFVVLFNALWYRDFPAPKEKYVKRANWTIHLGLVIKECSDLLGYYTAFESGNRTDAVIHDTDDRTIAKVEWEWDEPFKKSVNEIQKLCDSSAETELSVFISYCEKDNEHESLKKVKSIWKDAKSPLIVFLVMYERDGRNRNFVTLDTYEFRNDKPSSLLRSQPALPWDVVGSKWQG